MGTLKADGDGWRASKVAVEAAIRSSVSEEDVRAVMKALVEKARAGNVKAGEIVLDRLMGKPAAQVEGVLTVVRPVEELRARMMELLVTNPGLAALVGASPRLIEDSSGKGREDEGGLWPGGVPGMKSNGAG